MNYPQALDFITSRQRFGWRLDLSRIKKALADLKQPQNRYPSVLIAGTNGKGSVAVMLDTMIRSQGIKTGLYTSPHLYDIRERIQIDGHIIDKDCFAGLVLRLEDSIKDYSCTFFEALTLVAFTAFADTAVDVAILEVGLGGRFDATNVVKPILSIITSIDLDHTDHLGQSKTEIAAEKAGIIKAESLCLAGRMEKEVEMVIRRKCSDLKARFYRAPDYGRVFGLHMSAGGSAFQLRTADYSDQIRLSLSGPHQIGNFLIVAAALDLLGKAGLAVSPHRGFTAAQSLYRAGRFEIVSRRPLVVFDVAHNPGAMRVLAWMLKRFFADKRRIIVLGLLKDKDAETILSILADCAEDFYFVPLPTERGLAAETLLEKFTSHHGRACVSGSAFKVIQERKNRDADELICITGSHFHAEAVQRIKTLTF
jgi:dihydrofolate synthase/folylpolyglutamate synthase